MAEREKRATGRKVREVNRECIRKERKQYGRRVKNEKGLRECVSGSAVL